MRKPLLNQILIITRVIPNRLAPGKDTCTIYTLEFRGMITNTVYNFFRAAAITTLHRHLATVEHKQQSQVVTSIDQLSQPTHTLIHALYSVQPATTWTLDDIENTVVSTPIEIDYKPLRQQAHPYVLTLQDPRAIQGVIKFSIKPPRIRAHLRGDEAWTPW
jgi:hypothetical protein